MPPVPPIKIMAAEDISGLYALTESGRHTTESAYFERSLEEQAAGKRLVFIYAGEEGAQILGYAHYNRFPKYAPFRRFNIPEIQDLYVSPDHRQLGIGRALIAACEAQAVADGHQEIGIGVGIISDFGNAQRLYAKCGYIPDGAGIVYEREPCHTGQIRPLDDLWCLMLVKQLG
jgi:GNAT superfamily N-acetyltransferase